MVLSAILQTAWATNWFGTMTWIYPLTPWVDVLGNMLAPPLPTPKKPPDPSTPIAEEGERWGINQLSVEEFAAFSYFAMIPKNWDDGLNQHIKNMHCYATSCS